MVKKLISILLVSVAMLWAAPLVAQSDESMIEKPWYATVGAGWLFLEKDEEVLGQQLYEIRLGNHISDRWTIEGGFGLMPDVRKREFRRPGQLVLDDDTMGWRFVGDALYHFNDDAWGSSFDPYWGFGGGIAQYDKRLEDGHHDLFIATGPGAFFAFSDDWFGKADYRVAMVGENTEVNQHVLLSIGYRWGSDSDGMGNIPGAGDGEGPLKRVYFPFDSSALTAASKATLKANAQWMEDHPGESVVLEGHCDERGTNEYNLALGQRRAQSVFEYLLALGISRDRLQTVTYGEEVPLVAESNEAAWAKNRRVEFTLQ